MAKTQAKSPIHIPVFEIAKKLPRIDGGTLAAIAGRMSELDVSALVTPSIAERDNVIDLNIGVLE